MKIGMFPCHSGVQDCLVKALIKMGHKIVLFDNPRAASLTKHLRKGNRQKIIWNQIQDSNISMVSIRSLTLLTYAVRSSDLLVPFLWDRKMADLPPQVEVIPIERKRDFWKVLVSDVDLTHVGRLIDTLYALPLVKKSVFTHWWFPHSDKVSGFMYKLFKNVSVTEYGRDYLLEKQGIDSDVIYCPADVDSFKNLRTPDEKTVLAIGNFFATRPEQGWDQLVKVMRNVLKKDNEVRLGVVGINDDLVIPEDLRSNVFNIPFTHRGRLPEIIQQATCLAFPATFQLVPHSLIEGMACERPVVAFELESMAEIVCDDINGFLIPRFNLDMFAKRILEFTSDPSLGKEMGIEARKTVMRKCHYMDVARKYIGIFERL